MMDGIRKSCLNLSRRKEPSKRIQKEYSPEFTKNMLFPRPP